MSDASLFQLGAFFLGHSFGCNNSAAKIWECSDTTKTTVKQVSQTSLYMENKIKAYSRITHLHYPGSLLTCSTYVQIKWIR